MRESKLSPSAGPPLASTSESEQAAALFIEQMGLSAEGDGLPRIAGRMWGYFIVNEGHSSFAELAERLQVSRGSISTNARILRDLGILERVAEPGDRQDYYRLADKPFDRLMMGYVERMRSTQQNAAKAQAAQAPGSAAYQRLAEMQTFYHAAVVTTEQLIASLRANNAPEHKDLP